MNSMSIARRTGFVPLSGCVSPPNVETGGGEAFWQDITLTGKPGFPDGAEGIRLLRVAAGLGDAEACFTIGESYKARKKSPPGSRRVYRLGSYRGGYRVCCGGKCIAAFV